MSFLQFDASKVAPQERPAPIPAGLYLAQIVESAVAVLGSGNGEGIKLTWQVTDGQFHGRKVFQRINYRHTNPQAEQIGQSQLSAVCHAVGVIQLQDTQQLHGKPCRIRVKIRKDQSGQYDDQNEVSAVEGAGNPSGPPAAQMTAMPLPPSAPPAMAAAATQQRPATPPWQRRAG